MVSRPGLFWLLYGTIGFQRRLKIQVVNGAFCTGKVLVVFSSAAGDGWKETFVDLGSMFREIVLKVLFCRNSYVYLPETLSTEMYAHSGPAKEHVSS